MTFELLLIVGIWLAIGTAAMGFTYLLLHSCRKYFNMKLNIHWMDNDKKKKRVFFTSILLGPFAILIIVGIIMIFWIFALSE